MRQKPASIGYAQVAVVVAAAIVIAVATFILLNMRHRAAAPARQTANLSRYCVGQTVSAGSSGHCVRDLQALVNYLEHSGLTQCPFAGGAQLTVSGAYDAATTAQVRSVQGWANCYARQEGFTTNVRQTGKVDKATWGELCTYGFTNPSRNGAAGAAGSIAAGKDAGCAQLQS